MLNLEEKKIKQIVTFSPQLEVEIDIENLHEKLLIST